MYILNRLKIYRNINFGKESLPSLVTVSPSTDYSISECCVSCSRIPFLSRLCIFYCFSFSLVLESGLSKFSFSILINKIECRVASLSEKIDGNQCAPAEIRLILTMRFTPRSLGNGKCARPVHVFSVFVCKNVFRP